MKQTKVKRISAKQANDMDLLIKGYLKKNPEVRKSLEVFKISQSEYEKSVKAKMPVRIKSSRHTTISDGDVARN